MRNHSEKKILSLLFVTYYKQEVINLLNSSDIINLLNSSDIKFPHKRRVFPIPYWSTRS